MTRLSKEEPPEYQRRVSNLSQEINEIPKPKEPKEGEVAWVPCIGIQSMGIQKGHVGRICKAQKQQNGKTGWEYTKKWLSEEEAKRKYPKIKISDTHSSCPSCSRIINKHMDKARKN